MSKVSVQVRCTCAGAHGAAPSGQWTSVTQPRPPVSWAPFTTTSRVLVIGSVVSKPWLIIPCSPEREEMRRVLDDTDVHLRGEAAPAATPGWVGRPLAPATKRADPAALRCGLGRVNLHRAAHHVD